MRDAYGGGAVPTLKDAYRSVRSLSDSEIRLSAYISYAAGAVIAGLKPAVLVRFPECRLSLASVWRRSGNAAAERLGLCQRLLEDGAAGPAVLLYRPKSLARALSRNSVSLFLVSRGYEMGGSLEKKLDALAARYRGRERVGFPHEIGIFLGYPLADVVSFIERRGKPYPCRGYWRVYHNPQRARRIFDRLDQARVACFLVERTASGTESDR